MKKVWEKVLFVAAVLMIAPVMFLFAGCGPSTAKSVRNTTYHATSVLCNLETDETTLSGNPRFYFFDDYFRFEFGAGDAMGYVIGNYKIDRNDIILEMTDKGGMFKETIPSKLRIEKLHYKNKKLSIEFFEAGTGHVYQYVFER